MSLIGKHKAIVITCLITGVVTFSLFSVHMSRNQDFLSNAFYEVETEIETEILDELEESENNKFASTNKAYNEDEEFKAMMRNFKTVDANDFEKTIKKLAEKNISIPLESEKLLETTIKSTTTQDFALKQTETDNYKSLQALLDKKQDGFADHAEGKSTLTYSLKGRRLLNYDTPRYLCERSGKIVVNITVNTEGAVTEAYINNASNSENQCLHDHAIEYAKSVRFNPASKAEQIGSITFYFKGK